MHQDQHHQRQAPTCVSKDKIQHIQVLALEHIPVLSMRIRVAVHDGSCGCTEDDNINPLGQAVAPDVAP